MDPISIVLGLGSLVLGGISTLVDAGAKAKASALSDQTNKLNLQQQKSGLEDLVRQTSAQITQTEDIIGTYDSFLNWFGTSERAADLGAAPIADTAGKDNTTRKAFEETWNNFAINDVISGMTGRVGGGDTSMGAKASAALADLKGTVEQSQSQASIYRTALANLNISKTSLEATIREVDNIITGLGGGGSPGEFQGGEANEDPGNESSPPEGTGTGIVTPDTSPYPDAYSAITYSTLNGYQYQGQNYSTLEEAQNAVDSYVSSTAKANVNKQNPATVDGIPGDTTYFDAMFQPAPEGTTASEPTIDLSSGNNPEGATAGGYGTPAPNQTSSDVIAAVAEISATPTAAPPPAAVAAVSAPPPSSTGPAGTTLADGSYVGQFKTVNGVSLAWDGSAWVSRAEYLENKAAAATQADAERPVGTRKKSSGKWYYWDGIQWVLEEASVSYEEPAQQVTTSYSTKANTAFVSN